MNNFHTFKVEGRGSATQLQVGENLYSFTYGLDLRNQMVYWTLEITRSTGPEKSEGLLDLRNQKVYWTLEIRKVYWTLEIRWSTVL